MRTAEQRLADVLARLKLQCAGFKLGVVMCNMAPNTPSEVKDLLEGLIEATEAAIAVGEETDK